MIGASVIITCSETVITILLYKLLKSMRTQKVKYVETKQNKIYLLMANYLHS